MRLNLLVTQSSLELRHQVAGAEHVLAEPSNQFQSTAINQRDVENHVVGRVLHGDVVVGRENRFELLKKFLPARVLLFLARNRIEMAGLDFVN